MRSIAAVRPKCCALETHSWISTRLKSLPFLSRSVNGKLNVEQRPGRMHLKKTAPSPASLNGKWDDDTTEANVKRCTVCQRVLLCLVQNPQSLWLSLVQGNTSPWAPQRPMKPDISTLLKPDILILRRQRRQARVEPQ